MSILTKITTGRIARAQKVVIYAPEGFGKSTLASKFPSPVFLDVEGSTSQLDVARLTRGDLPTIKDVESALTEIASSRACATVVVDTADWLEQMAVDTIISDAGNPKIVGIEDFGYGKGYIALKERVTILLAKLDAVIAASINVVLLAHSKVAKFEPPDGAGPYDRYELKLSKHVAPLIKEWADMVLFGNYRTQVREKDKNESGQQFKGVGGKERQLYATRCASWDAKNRHGMGDVEKWDIAVIESAFQSVGAPWGGLYASAPAAPVAPAAVESASDEIPGLPPSAPVEQSADDLAFARICAPHGDTITNYLRLNGKINHGQDFNAAPLDYKKRVLKNPAGFLKVAVKGDK